MICNVIDPTASVSIIIDPADVRCPQGRDVAPKNSGLPTQPISALRRSFSSSTISASIRPPTPATITSSAGGRWNSGRVENNPATARATKKAIFPTLPTDHHQDLACRDGRDHDQVRSTSKAIIMRRLIAYQCEIVPPVDRVGHSEGHSWRFQRHLIDNRPGLLIDEAQRLSLPSIGIVLVTRIGERWPPPQLLASMFPAFSAGLFTILSAVLPLGIIQALSPVFRWLIAVMRPLRTLDQRKPHHVRSPQSASASDTERSPSRRSVAAPKRTRWQWWRGCTACRSRDRPTRPSSWRRRPPQGVAAFPLCRRCP